MDARMRFPSQDDVVTYSVMVYAREPLVRNVIGFVDGLSVPVRCSDNLLDQNAAYNGTTTILKSYFVPDH
jgi:hypothetical protein